MSGRPKITDVIHQGLRLNRAIRLVWTSAPGWAAVNLVLLVAQGLLPLAGLYLLKRVVDSVQAGIAATDKGAAFHVVLLWAAAAAVVAALVVLARSVASVSSQAQAMVVSDKVSDILHAQSIAVDLEYYEDHGYYDTLQRAQQEAPYRPTHIVNGLVTIGQNALSLVGVAGLLLAFNWLVGVVLFAVAVPGAIVRLVYSRRMYRFEQEQAKSERRGWYYHWMLTDSDHAKELRLFDLGSLFRQRFRELRQQLREGRLGLTRRRTTADFLTQVGASAVIFGTLAFIAHQAVFTHQVTVGSLVMYYSGFQMGVSSLQAILGGLAGLYEDNLFLSNFYQFLDIKPRITVPDRPRPVPVPLRQGVVFHNAGFVYPGSGQQILEGINLRIEPGQVIALVGPNGSGKTTLVKLLCRLYDPTQGSITLDGVDLRAVDPIAWRHQLSVVFQDYLHYHMKAWENIWLGNVAEESDRAAIIRAAELSGADAAIRRLPDGYDTQLGYWFEGGRELSIGEWQNVALARAFLRDSQLVVLDEPTSSLDALAEAEVFGRFRRTIQGRSAVLISHRFSTVKMADYIYVLDKGRIVESGPHQELLERNGLYAKLYLAQAANYQE